MGIVFAVGAPSELLLRGAMEKKSILRNNCPKGSTSIGHPNIPV